MALEDIVSAAIGRYGMLDKVSSVLAALSGGSDSVALLGFLKGYCEKNNIRLYAAHVNHQIRGDEAYRDQVFCEKLCGDIGVPLFVGIFDVPAAAREKKLSVETAAREIRYSYFESLLDLYKIDVCATAHNARDRAETVLFNLLRGSSLSGASGIPPVRGRYIRPLISCPKEEIIEYDNLLGYGWVEDSTNKDTEYTRNYIRRELLPRFDRISPGNIGAICRFADAADRDESYISSIAARYTADTPVITLKNLHDSVLFRWLRDRFEEYGCGEFGETHIKAAADLVKYGAQGAMLSLPGLVRMTVNDTVVFTVDPRAKQYDKGYCLRLIPGEEPVYISEADAAVCLIFNEQKIIKGTINIGENIYKLSIRTPLCFDKIKGNIFVTSRRDGDRIECLGIDRSLGRLMSICRMNMSKRDTTPVFRDDSGIIAVPELMLNGRSVCRDELFCAAEDDKTGYLLLYKK